MEEDAVVDDIDGCIKSIHVKNFFCHDNLEVNFNRNVNFIIGRNGSGKSAILTALVVGLGGRASSTNRGNNLHSFIKKGANSASIEIKIKNHTSYAYKPEVYGDCITVIRNLTASGGSNYKIKASNGEVKSTKFEDVVKITTALDIQVDNPISVLNQDDARSFHASDGKKKYALFRRATNMAQTEVNYNIALENCKTATNIWQKKSDACAVQEKEYKKLRTIYEHLQTRDDVKAKKVALQNEFYWSEIANLEKDVAHQQAIYDKHNERIEKLMDKLSRMEQDFGTNNSTIDNLKKELSAKKGEKTVLEAELVKLEGEVRDKQATWRNEQTKHARASDAAKRERRKIADFEAEIQSIDSGNAATRREALEARSAEAAAAASAAEARYNTARHHNEQARANAQRAQAQADQADARVRRQRDQIKQLKQQSRELSSRSDDSLAVFGTQMVELVKRVRSAASRGQFSAPPRGPIGSAEYLKVKDSKWGGALEHILGGSMRAFCVNTPEDSRKLFEIMNQVYGSSPKPSVTCSKFLPKKHDVRRNKVVADGFVCALDSLDVSDPVVANYLIDNLNMESILLVPSHDDAIRLSDKRENVPPRCSKIVTLDSSEYYPAPNYRSYGGAGRPARLLHTSVDQRRRQVEAEIKEAEATLASLESRAEAERAESQTAHNEERTAARALQALMSERHEAQEAAKAAAAALETEHTPHLAVLVDELNLSKEKMKSLQAQLDEYSAKEREHREAIDAYDVRMRKIKTKVGQATTTCRNLSEEIDNEQLRQDQSVTEKQSCQRKAEEERVKLAAVQRALEEKRKATAEKTEEALQLCERVRNPRDLTIVQEEIKKMNAKLNSIMSEGMTKEEVLEKLSAVGEKYQRTKQTLDKLNKLIADVKNSIDKHRSYCKKLQHYIQKRVQHNFQIMLSLRNFCGSMEIDNKVGQLEIRCTGREVSRAAASTASLSGGERSYSTVAFIMALWRCVELPFYFMDEFDVFMDNVNRSSVMKLLIDHALNNRSRQFVFLTPQDTSAVSAGPYLKIHKMADPRP